MSESEDRWERDAADAVIERVEAGGGDARQRLRALFALAGADAPTDTGMALELAVGDWARREPAVAERLHRVHDRRIEYLRELFATFLNDEDEIEVRSLLTMSLHVGSHLVAARHGARTRSEVVALTLERLLR